MWIVWCVAGAALILLTLSDSFETVIQPRRVTHRFRFARLYFKNSWTTWRAVAIRIPNARAREAFLAAFGPLSMLGLLLSWMIMLIFGFALIHWALKSPVTSPDRVVGFSDYLYLSGTMIFTLGLGDIAPLGDVGRALCVIESGLGFGFLALIVSYVPVLYQAYASREAAILLLDARAGSPPTAGQFLTRLARTAGDFKSLDATLAEWERWCGVLLESQLSFPVLITYRSQHQNQSWLAALTTALDTCALLLSEVKLPNTHQTQMTFAMARHAAVDICLVLKIRPGAANHEQRFSAEMLDTLRGHLRDAGIPLSEDQSHARLSELRAMYEPFILALAEHSLFDVPPMLIDGEPADNWQRSAWMQRTPGIGDLPVAGTDSDHFD